jgi:phage gp29-like protein
MNIFQRLSSALGLSRTKAPRMPSGRVIPTLSIWDQLQRIGGGLTPVQVSAIIREADNGQMTRLMDLANDSRQKDCHLQSVLATSEESIAGLDWELCLPEDAKATEKKAAEWIESVLRDTPGLPRLFAHHAGARFYGYAVSETLFKKQDGDIVPKEFEHLAPRRFGFNQVTGAFVWRDQNMPFEGVDFRAQYPLRFIVSQPRITGDVPCREGLVRVLMWAALFRNWDLSDWLKLAEIAWKPWRTAKYQDGVKQEDIDKLVEILDGMTSNGVAIYPERADLKVEWPTGGSGRSATHAELFSVIAGEMSKAVLGQTLTTEQGKVGSKALGDVQNEIRKDLREATARYVAADVTRDLIDPLYTLNYGPRLRRARLKFLTQDARDFRELAAGVKDFVTAGAKIPHSWVYDEAGIAEPKEDEEILEMGKPEAEEVDIPIDPDTGLPKVPDEEPRPGEKPAAKPAAEDDEDKNEAA